MMNRSEMQSWVRQWREELAKIDADPRLTAAGKQEKVSAANAKYGNELREWGAHEMKMAQTTVDRTAAKLTETRKAHQDKGDWARLVALHMENEHWANTVESWDDARAAVSAAIADGDAALVRSLNRIAVPILLHRARTEDSLRDGSPMVAELRSDLANAAEALRPTELVAAENAHKAARQQLEQLRTDLLIVDGESAHALGLGLQAGGALADVITPQAAIFAPVEGGVVMPAGGVWSN